MFPRQVASTTLFFRNQILVREDESWQFRFHFQVSISKSSHPARRFRAWARVLRHLSASPPTVYSRNPPKLLAGINSKAHLAANLCPVSIFGMRHAVFSRMAATSAT